MMWLYIAVIAVLVCAVESAYCYLRKRMSRGAKEENQSKTDNAGNDDEKKGMLIRCVVLANDFTFLLGKIIGYVPSHLVRMFFYKYIFHMTIGKRVVIYYGLEFRSPWNIVIGDNTIVGDKAIFDARYGIEIGENVNISTGVWIWTLQHDLNAPDFGTEGKEGKVTVKNRAWVSSRSVLLPGSTIQEGSVIAAGAVVSGKKEILPYSVYGGIPAKKIADRNRELTYTFDGKHRWFL